MKDVANPSRELMETKARDARIGPPCVVFGADIIYLRFSVERAAAQRQLPRGFSLDANGTGCIGLYTSTAAQGVAPHSACFFALGLANHETSDRDVGLFIVGDLRSEPAASMFRTHYCDSATGWATIEREGDRIVGEAGTEGSRWLVRIEGRRTEQHGTLLHLTDEYFARGASPNNYNFYTTTGRQRYVDLAEATVSFAEEAPEWMRALKPLLITMPLTCDGAELLFGIPQVRDLAGEAMRREDLMSLFSGLGRPALIVGQNGRILQANPESQALAADLRGVLSTQSEVASAVLEALTSRRPVPPLHLSRGEREPLLVQALPLTPALAGEPAVLLLLNDPERPRTVDAGAPLRLLGLTPSEARLAAAIGRGKPPKDAATSLGISEGNARTTLKAVFRKLGLTRQAELVRLVGRLETA